MQDSQTDSHAAAHRRTSGAPAASVSQQQPAGGVEPAAADEVCWALNDAAIPDTTVFQPLQHAQQQPDADAPQQAGPTKPDDVSGAAPAFVDASGDTAGSPAASQLLTVADPVPSSAGAFAGSVQAHAEAARSGTGDSWQLDGGAAAGLAEAAAAGDMLCAKPAEAADLCAFGAASGDAQEVQAPADVTAAESTEALDADSPAAATMAAGDAEVQSGLVQASPPQASHSPAADQNVPDACSTAAIELVMLPAAEFGTDAQMRSTVAETATMTALEAASTASEGSAAVDLLAHDESGAPAADASAADADIRDVQASYQLPAEAMHGLYASDSANITTYGGDPAAATIRGIAGGSIPSDEAEGVAGLAGMATDPAQAIDEVQAAAQHSAEGYPGYGTSGSISSSSSSGSIRGGGGSVNDPVLISHETSANGSVMDAAAPAIEAEGLAKASSEHTTAVVEDEAYLDEHGGKVSAGNLAQLSGVAAAAALSAEPSADGEQGCTDPVTDCEHTAQHQTLRRLVAESGRTADVAAASTIDDQDGEDTLEVPDMHVLSADSQPAEPQRHDAPAAYDTDSSWDDY